MFVRQLMCVYTLYTDFIHSKITLEIILCLYTYTQTCTIIPYSYKQNKLSVFYLSFVARLWSRLAHFITGVQHTHAHTKSHEQWSLVWECKMFSYMNFFMTFQFHTIYYSNAWSFFHFQRKQTERVAPQTCEIQIDKEFCTEISI